MEHKLALEGPICGQVCHMHRVVHRVDTKASPQRARAQQLGNLGVVGPCQLAHGVCHIGADEGES